MSLLTRALARQRDVLPLTIGIVLVAALTIMSIEPYVYEATTELNDRDRTPGAVATEQHVLESPAVVDAATRALSAKPVVHVRRVGRVLQVKARSISGDRAADVANGYANAYLEVRRTQLQDQLARANRDIFPRVTQLQQQIDNINTQISDASGADRAALERTLGPRRDALTREQQVANQRLEQLGIDTAARIADVTLTSPAISPSGPIWPRPVRTIFIAIVIGALLGLVATVAVDAVDDAVRDADDLGRWLPQPLPVIGLIPWATPGLRSRLPFAAAIREPTSATVEAFRSLRTPLQVLAENRGVRVVQVTSPGPMQGKTTTVTNLGVVLGRAGYRVVVVCCDLRRPALYEAFGVSNAVGFTSVLLGDKPLSVALQPVPNEPRLLVLPAGPVPPNPSELLSSPRATEVLAAVATQADFVLVDCPPVLPVADAGVLATHVDVTLLVVGAGRTRRAELRRAVAHLRQISAPLVGAVLNGVSERGAFVERYEATRPTSTRSRSAKSR